MSDTRKNVISITYGLHLLRLLNEINIINDLSWIIVDYFGTIPNKMPYVKVLPKLNKSSRQIRSYVATYRQIPTIISSPLPLIQKYQGLYNKLRDVDIDTDVKFYQSKFIERIRTQKKCSSHNMKKPHSKIYKFEGVTKYQEKNHIQISPYNPFDYEHYRYRGYRIYYHPRYYDYGYFDNYYYLMGNE